MRCLVARMDGTAESGFAPGSITPTSNVPVVLSRFVDDSPFRAIGTAEIEVEGDQVIAVLTLQDGFDATGLYPALGGIPSAIKDGVYLLFRVLEVGLNRRGNQDPQIPAITRST
jgi:hypothetical protein